MHFLGYDEINMDAKGRIGLPTRYHSAVSVACEGKFVITVDLVESCLVLYPLPQWGELVQGLTRLPSTNPNSAKIKRRLIGYATEVTMDGTGRLLISPELRSFAGLEKAVVLTGQGNKCEIWSKAAWDKTQADTGAIDLSSPDLAAVLNNLAL